MGGQVSYQVADLRAVLKSALVGVEGDPRNVQTALAVTDRGQLAAVDEGQSSVTAGDQVPGAM